MCLELFVNNNYSGINKEYCTKLYFIKEFSTTQRHELESLLQNVDSPKMSTSWYSGFERTNLHNVIAYNLLLKLLAFSSKITFKYYITILL